MLKVRIFSLLLMAVTSSFAMGAARWQHSGCENEYAALFDEPEVRMTVAFGYFDVDRGGVVRAEDVYSYNGFIKNITRNCSLQNPDDRVCGFQEEAGSATAYTKIYSKWMLGPDGLMRNFRMTIGHGSETTDDSLNRNSAEQRARSAAVREMFLDGLRNAHVVLYDGHSRDGGGPDFDPPVLKHGHTDYDWYHRHPKDKVDMVSALASNPSKSRLVILSSCSSIRWFSQKIENAAPAVGFMGTTDVTALLQIDKIFNSIFNFKCLKQEKFHDPIFGADLKLESDWNVPDSLKNISDAEMQSKIYQNLARNLKSKNPTIRKASYDELKSQKPSKLPQKVRVELGAYELMKTALGALGFDY